MILAASPVTRYRYVQTRVNGRAVRTLEGQATIRATVQPVRGHELERLPEADRARVELKAYTQDDLRTADDSTGVPADIVQTPRGFFEVIRVEHQEAILPHTKAFLARLEAAPFLPAPPEEP